MDRSILKFISDAVTDDGVLPGDFRLPEQEDENKVMLDYLKDSLDGKVSAVRLSHKLKSHPVCLSTDGEVSLGMEKYFASVPGDMEKGRKRGRGFLAL